MPAPSFQDDPSDTLSLIAEETIKLASLEKVIHLVALLVEGSRDASGKLQLSEKDIDALRGNKVS